MDRQTSDWMRLPGWETEELAPRLALFRGRLLLDETPDSAPIHLTADSRYKLYVNDTFVETGPARGNGKTWYMGTVKHILDFFHRHLDERGLVGKTGDMNRPGQFWSFIDWTAGWDETDGVPPATKQSPITMESLLYILDLQYAAELA